MMGSAQRDRSNHVHCHYKIINCGTEYATYIPIDANYSCLRSLDRQLLAFYEYNQSGTHTFFKKIQT